MSFLKHISRGEPEGEGFPFTPLVDVMFTLLIFIVITAQYSDMQEIKVQLPKAKSGSEQDKTGVIVISIQENGKIHLDSQEVDPKTLESRLGSIQNKEQAVVLRADEISRTGKLVEVMDIASRAGFRKISVQTRKN